MPDPIAASLVLALVAGLSRPAVAGVGVGLGVDMVADLPDSVYRSTHADFGPGVGFHLPVRWQLRPEVALRATARGATGAGTDQLLWSEYDGQIRRVSDDHQARYLAAGLDLGPELSLSVLGPLDLFAGAEAGLVWVQSRQTVEGDASLALAPDAGGAATLFTTAQLAPAAGLHGGLRWIATSSFAIEVEAGYNVSFLKEVALRDTDAALDAVRTAYGLNALRAGVAATFFPGDRKRQ